MIKLRPSIPSFLAAVSVLLCVVSSAKAQDKVLLRMNLHQGQTFDQGFAMETKMSQTQKERIDMMTTMHINTHNEVLNVAADGDIKLKTTYQSVSIQTQANRGKKSLTFSYDSKKPQEKSPVGLNSLAALVGQSLIITISPRGETLNVDGIDALVQHMLANDKSTVGRKELEKSFKIDLLDQAKQFLGIAVFSESPVAVGQSWTTTNVRQSVSILMSGQYTLMSSQNNIATLAVRSKLSPNTKTPPKLTPDNPIYISMSGNQNGVMRVDERSGLISSFELHQRILGQFSMARIQETFNGKKSTTTVTKPISWPIYMAGTIRGWTVKLPQ